MNFETDTQSPHQGWFSRVAQSAGSLTHDLLSLDAAYAATGDLQSFRQAKGGDNHLHDHNRGLPGQRQQQKYLSKRHKANTILKNPRRYQKSGGEELEDEVLDFLRRDCAIDKDGASSSRSVSPLSGRDDDGHQTPPQWNTADLQDFTANGSLHHAARPHELASSRNDSFMDIKKDVRHDVQESLEHLSLADGLPIYQDFSSAQRRKVAAALANREAAHFDTHWRNASKTSASTDPIEKPQRNATLSKTARLRLELVSKHLAARDAAASNLLRQQSNSSEQKVDDPSAIAASTVSPVFEMGYNQVCHGEGLSQDWNFLLAEGPYCRLRRMSQQQYQNLQQQQQHLSSFQGVSHIQTPLATEQRVGTTTSTTAIPSLQHLHTAFMDHASSPLSQQPKLQHLRAALMDHASSPVAQQTQQRSTTLPRQKQQQQQQQQQQQKEEKDTLSGFHCPYIGCHMHLRAGYQYSLVNNAEMKNKLACVHEGCDGLFDGEEAWREHVLGAHHGLLEKVEGEVSIDQQQQEDEKDFEMVWEESVQARE